MLANGEPVDRRKDQARAAGDLNRNHLGFSQRSNEAFEAFEKRSVVGRGGGGLL
jgi:hypothetical protein